MDGGCPVVVPLLSEKSAHIKKMVEKQKYHPPKRVSGIRLPAHCRYVNATPQMSSAHHSTNYNSNYKQQRIFLPVSLQQRIYKMIHDNPKVILRNFSEMCAVTNSTFCNRIVLFKPREYKCMKLYKMLLAGSASPDH
jgi:hypothetical protein